MKLRDFRRYARHHQAKAVIISDGCRDYVIEIHQAHGAGLLTDRRGRALRYPSLAEAKHAVRHASEIHLAVRVAADEACAGTAAPEANFSHVPLMSKAA